MNETIADKLESLAVGVHWFGMRDESNALKLLAAWLRLNGADTVDDVAELLESTNDNPNIQPLRINAAPPAKE